MNAVDGDLASPSPGEMLGIVGESGSGKTVTMLAVMGLLAQDGADRRVRSLFRGQDLLGLQPSETREIRGARSR